MTRIDFSFVVPANLKEGDNIFFINDQGGASLLGSLLSIINDGMSIIVDADPTTVRPDIGQTILFAPNRSVELSGIIGYEGTCVMVNDSTQRAELFAVSTEVFESSR